MKKDIKLNLKEMEKVVGGRRWKIELPDEKHLTEEDKELIRRLENIKL